MRNPCKRYKKYWKQILLVFTYMICFSAFSQITLLEKYPFQNKEEVIYDAIYKWGLIELRAGIVVFRVDSIQENGESIYHFTSTGNTKEKYDWIFKIRDTFQSKVRVDNFRPLYYQRNTLERSYSVFNETFFQEDEGLIMMHLENNEDGFKQVSLPYQDDVLDLQTAVYFARLLNFEDARMGDGYEFNIIIDGQPYTIPIRYEGKETVFLAKDRQYSCYRISTQVIEGTIFKSGQTIKVWVSDDGRQIPVKVEAPIIIGEVKAELVEIR